MGHLTTQLCTSTAALAPLAELLGGLLLSQSWVGPLLDCLLS